MNDFFETYCENLKKIRETKPLVHHITNFVTMQDCANLAVAIGASPMMAFFEDEVEEIAAAAKSVVLNCGTPSPERLKAILRAGKAANQNNVPVVLDPVGVGASKFRKEGICEILKEVHPHVLKGNVSEIMTIAGLDVTKNRVVDTTEFLEHSLEVKFRQLARQMNCVIVATGKEDLITDGKRICRLDRGSSYLTKVSGSGCMTATLIGCFLAVEQDAFQAAFGGILTINEAGEWAEKNLTSIDGEGMFKVRMFDAISKVLKYQKKEGVFFVS